MAGDSWLRVEVHLTFLLLDVWDIAVSYVRSVLADWIWSMEGCSIPQFLIRIELSFSWHYDCSSLRKKLWRSPLPVSKGSIFAFGHTKVNIFYIYIFVPALCNFSPPSFSFSICGAALSIYFQVLFWLVVSSCVALRCVWILTVLLVAATKGFCNELWCIFKLSSLMWGSAVFVGMTIERNCSVEHLET